MSNKDILIEKAFKNDLRARFPLLKEGHVTLGDLTELTANQVSEIRNVGPTVERRIRMVLKLHGLAFKDETL